MFSPSQASLMSVCIYGGKSIKIVATGIWKRMLLCCTWFLLVPGVCSLARSVLVMMNWILLYWDPGMPEYCSSKVLEWHRVQARGPTKAICICTHCNIDMFSYQNCCGPLLTALFHNYMKCSVNPLSRAWRQSFPFPRRFLAPEIEWFWTQIQYWRTTDRLSLNLSNPHLQPLKIVSGTTSLELRRSQHYP